MANTDYYKWQGYNANDTMVIKKLKKLSAIAEVWERIYWLRHFYVLLILSCLSLEIEFHDTFELTETW